VAEGEKGTKMTPEQVDKVITFGQMALEQGWYDQAREHFERALALDASNREAMKGLARANEVLRRRASLEPMKSEVTSAEPASQEHLIARWMRKKIGDFAEWLRKKHRAYEEWADKRRWERKRRAAERLVAEEIRRKERERRAAKRLAAEEIRRREMLDREAEEYREWYETGVAAWEERYSRDELIGGFLMWALLEDDDMFDDFF